MLPFGLYENTREVALAHLPEEKRDEVDNLWDDEDFVGIKEIIQQVNIVTLKQHLPRGHNTEEYEGDEIRQIITESLENEHLDRVNLIISSPMLYFGSLSLNRVTHPSADIPPNTNTVGWFTNRRFIYRTNFITHLLLTKRYKLLITIFGSKSLVINVDDMVEQTNWGPHTVFLPCMHIAVMQLKISRKKSRHLISIIELLFRHILSSDEHKVREKMLHALLPVFVSQAIVDGLSNDTLVEKLSNISGQCEPILLKFLSRDAVWFLLRHSIKFDNKDNIEFIITNTLQETFFEIITKEDKLGSLFERGLRQYSKNELYKLIINRLTPQQTLEQLTRSTWCGDWLLTDLTRSDDKQDVVQYLLQFTHSATDEKKEQLHEQLIQGSLSQKMIQILNELNLDHYIVPLDQTKAKKYALVYYNVVDRDDGGEEEAQSLIDGLKAAKYEAPHVLKDWTEEELILDMTTAISNAKKDCSLLLVFLMAHGFEDHVVDKLNKEIPLRELSDIINGEMAKGIPKIFIVQACQVFRDNEEPENGEADNEEADSGEADKWEVKIIFYKAKTKTETKTETKTKIPPVIAKDFDRVMAAARGEEVYRNVFLPTFIKVLNKATELGKKTDLDAILTEVTKLIKEERGARINVTHQDRSFSKKPPRLS